MRAKESKTKNADNANVTKFIFELGQLKKVKRSGWWLAGIKEPESVAEHTQRTACIAYLLAKMENANAEKTVVHAIFHDMHETRLNDLHKVGRRYINEWQNAKKQAMEEELSVLPESIGKELKELIDANNNDGTKEGVIVKDADLLECAFTAKEYLEIGYKEAQDWIDNVGP